MVEARRPVEHLAACSRREHDELPAPGPETDLLAGAGEQGEAEDVPVEGEGLLGVGHGEVHRAHPGGEGDGERLGCCGGCVGHEG